MNQSIESQLSQLEALEEQEAAELQELDADLKAAEEVDRNIEAFRNERRERLIQNAREHAAATLDPDDPFHPDNLEPNFFLADRQFWRDIGSRSHDAFIDAPRSAAVELVQQLVDFGQSAAEDVLPFYGELSESVGLGRDTVDDAIEGYQQENFPLETGAGKFSSVAVQAIAAFIPAKKMVQITTGLREGVKVEAMAAALVDGFAFDPDDPNLINVLNGIDGDIGDGYLQFLETDPDDEEALNRLRNMIVGGGLGAAGEMLAKVLRLARAKYHNKKAERLARKQAEGDNSLADIDSEADEVLEERVTRARRQSREEAEAEAKADPEAKPKAEADEPLRIRRADEAENTRPLKPEELDDNIRNRLQLDEDDIKNITTALREGNFRGAREILSKSIQSADMWDRLPDEETGLRVMAIIAEQIEDKFEDFVRGSNRVETDAMVMELAKEIGIDEAKVGQLVDDLVGESGLAARVLAAGMTVVDNTRHLKRKLRWAARADASDRDKAEFFAAAERNAELLALFQRSRTEIGRAQRAGRLFKEMMEDAEIDIDHFIKTSARGRQLWNSRKEMLKAKGVKEVHKHTGVSKLRRAGLAVQEMYYGNLLSSPITLAIVNPLSNGLALLLNNAAVLTAYTAGIPVRAIGKMFGKEFENVITEAEMAQRGIGLMEGLIRGGKSAWQTIKTGSPSFDKRSKVYNDLSEVIYTDPKLYNSKLGKGGAHAINTAGYMFRSPMSLLSATDDIFKALNYLPERRVKAFRLAAKKVAARKTKPKDVSKAIDDEMREILKDPEAFHERSLFDARYAVFQEKPQTPLGDTILNLGARPYIGPIFRFFLMPFISTPGNLQRQALIDSNPVLFHISRMVGQRYKQRWDALDPIEKQTLTAKQVLASSIVAWGFWANDTEKDIVVGKRQRGDSAEFDDRPDYSLKIPFTDNTWFGFNRIDPVGTLMGMGIEARRLWDEYNESRDPEVKDAALAMIELYTKVNFSLLLNESWMTSAMQTQRLMDAFVNEDRSVWEHYLARWSGQQARKLIPMSSFLGFVEGFDDPLVREAWGVRDQIMANLPFLSDDLPVSYDYMGYKRVEKGLLHTAEDDPLRKELSRLAFTYSPDEKSLKGVRLTPEQYSRWMDLMGNTPRDIFNGQTLREFLTDFIQTEEYKSYSEGFAGYEGGKVKAIKAWRSQAKALAEQELYAEFPNLEDNILLRLGAKAKALGENPADFLAEFGFTPEDLERVHKKNRSQIDFQ
jgi:hypothetical protein